MKCFAYCVFLTFFVLYVTAAEVQLQQDLQTLAEQILNMKKKNLEDISRLSREIEDLRVKRNAITDNHERNEQATLQWAKRSMEELRSEMREMRGRIDNSVLLKELHIIRNQLKQALGENTDLAKLARTQETRIDKMDDEMNRLKYEQQQMRAMIADLRTHVGKVAKELKTKAFNEINKEIMNEVIEPDDDKPSEINFQHIHKVRHSKMVHTQISRLSRSQDQLDEYQQNLQIQILDVQRRLDRIEQPNWNLMTAKMEFVEIEIKTIREEVKNTTQKMSDLDKVHASMLELREDVESVENKVDKTIPDFRKEISKLDVSSAQFNAQLSYLKEDQENLRQSVKAIAVSISNAIDRAEMDRLDMKKINDSVYELETKSRLHFYKLNDHILKSEANNYDANISQIIPLPELMGEVKELQPVEREYEDLVNQLPKDCSSILGPVGAYLIRPNNIPVDAWCINGSTLIQRRFNGSVEFNRKFTEYVHGFGDSNSEYWLGLESMHQLTYTNCSSMRIDMVDIYGGSWYAEYEHFSVGSEETGYVLDVDGFKGNASDAFEYQNHMEFSTIDRDHDVSNTHCAGNYEGGWWYSHCQHVNINGKYTLGLTWFDSARNEWIAVASSEMKLFTRTECK